MNMQKDQADKHPVLPRDISILPLRNTVAYPYSVMPLVVGVPRSVKLVEAADGRFTVTWA